jgi:acyl-CoA synthetase (AMP-forming)/AMP-acid ligase II
VKYRTKLSIQTVTIYGKAYGKPRHGCQCALVKDNAITDTQFNLALAQEAVGAGVPEREYLIWRDRRFTYRQLTQRSRRLASYLYERGLGVHAERDQLAGHESGQDHVALYMRNCNEFIEAMLGAFKSRTVPVNVNYRYVADELSYLFRDARARAVIPNG